MTISNFLIVDEKAMYKDKEILVYSIAKKYHIIFHIIIISGF